MCIAIDYVIQGFIAIGTVGALVAAVYQIHQESKLRKEEKKKSQAINVSAWFEDTTIVHQKPIQISYRTHNALIYNGNLTPIYDVVITVVGFHGNGPSKHGEDNGGDCGLRAAFPQIATGLWSTDIGYDHGMGVVCALEISFRDGLGNSWIRRGDGELVEIKADPLDYYSIPRPVSWHSAERVD